MQNTYPFLTILIVGGIAVIVGALIGYLVSFLENRLTDALKKGRGEGNPDGLDDEKPTPKLEELNVLKVTIDPVFKWHLELDGVRLEPDGLTVEQRTRLVNVVVQIRPWIDGKTLPAPVAPALPKLSDADQNAAAAALVASTSIGTQPVASTAPRVDVRRGFMTMLENDLKKPAPPKDPSIVELIDKVLQEKLAGSPLAEKNIRLEEGSVGEVVVFVGVTRYSGIDAVPDDAIKTIIREAIAEWDKK